MWQTGGSNPSPNYSQRASFYGLSGYPQAMFGGTEYVQGGLQSGSMYFYYLPKYNLIINIDSPLDISIGVLSDSKSEIIVQALVEVTDTITTTNNKIIFIITRYVDSDWFCTVERYEDEPFYLTSVGQTEMFEKTFTLEPDWNLDNIKAVVIVQTWNNDPAINRHRILQGAQSFTGLIPMFSSNIQEGPACLGVQFYNESYPQVGIISWEWDFNEDGVWDSTEENPYYLYETTGVYDVTLQISDGIDTLQVTEEDFITVTDGSNISGIVAGVWNTAFSPYTITDDVSIPDGCELTIEPDVQIITNNNSKIKVEGKIVADASGKGPIIFTSNDSWKGIQFFNTMEANLIQNCEITNATYCAIDIENSKVDIIENTIYENSTTTQKGAAINVIGLDSVYIYKNLIANNISSILCAGIVCDNANPLISHNIIVNNTASFAGAISLKNSSNPTMINNTIANNESTSGFGAMWFASSSATVNNCILIDDLDVFNLLGSTVYVTYTCISGGYSGTGNINEDPMFENPTAGSGTSYNGLEASWNLLEGSPCIDAGDPASPPDPDSTIADMGALYFNQGIAVDPNCTNLGISLQNYPNPFKGSTTIEYAIKGRLKAEPVEIRIYNVTGQLIETIEAQNGMAVCEAGNLPPGVYFYQLKSDNNNVVKKMLLLR